MIAPTTGKMQIRSKPTLLILVADILPMLKFVIRNTTQLAPQPPAATGRPPQISYFQNQKENKLRIKLMIS